jgi:4-hydroxymandelate oxidase
MTGRSRPLNLLDLEGLARDELPHSAYDYYAGGSDDELTLAENRAAWSRLKLRYRVLRDVSRRELSVDLLGSRSSLPVVLAPTAFHRMAHPDGELATVRAAGRAGVTMILSTLANTAMEEVLANASAPVWFQLYVYRDREATRDLVRRAEEAGCAAIVLTVDAQVWGRRERDVRNGFGLPDGLTVANLGGRGMGELPPQSAGSGLAAYVTSLFDPALSWKDVDWLCSTSRLPVVLKGIVHPDDAREAVRHGAAGLVVSNHGGRQLDGAPATAEALPEVVAAVDGQAEVLVDGGIRRGTDVVRALALGARAAGIGRPVLWGLAWDGESGVVETLEMLRREIDLALALCGCDSASEVPAAGTLGEPRRWWLQSSECRGILD